VTADEHGHGHAHGHAHAHRGDGDLARGAGDRRILFLDCFSGVSGDMLVGALIDVGVPFHIVRDAIATLGIEGIEVELGARVRSGIVARRFEVRFDGAQPERTWGRIRELLEGAPLPAGARDIALDAFRRLADAEGRVHGMAPEDVAFHEVGAADSIADVVGAAVAFDYLRARVVSSPLPMGRGTVRARHGILPLPAPATVYCLRGVPTCDGGAESELVTPTGACLVATVAREFARWPSMKPKRVGWGSGTRDLPDRPNLLRVVLGEPVAEASAATGAEPFVVVETNVDDTTAELVAHAVDALLSAGALDAWTTPIGMKKGRPATMVCALARRASAHELARVLLRETSTLGVRLRGADRIERPRRIVEVDTPFGRIPVKVAGGDGLPENLAPEFDACREAAARHGVAVKEVYAAALRAATDLG